MLSNEVITELISDFHSRWVPPLAPRALEVELLPGRVTAIYGPRRSGKTFYLFQLAEKHARRTAKRQSVLYVNFEDERILPAVAQDIGRIVDRFRGMTAESGASEILILFDEIQNVQDWPLAVRRLCDQRFATVVLTGSSSRMLGKELSTRLRGRTLGYELLPLSFSELATLKGIDPNSQTSESRALLENLLREYLKWGGYPEIWTLTESERLRRKILQDYFTMTFYRDIVERYGVTNTEVLRQTMKYLAANCGALFSVNGFYKHLKSLGLSLAKDSLYRYLEYLDDALLYFSVFRYSRSLKEQAVSPRKVYMVDTGLRNAITPPGHFDQGRQLESIVFLELRRRGYDVYYWRERRECDFVAVRDGEPLLVIQVASRIDTPETLKREMEGLAEARDALGVDRALLLVDDFTLAQEAKPKELVMLFRWLVSRGHESGE